MPFLSGLGEVRRGGHLCVKEASDPRFAAKPPNAGPENCIANELGPTQDGLDGRRHFCCWHRDAGCARAGGKRLAELLHGATSVQLWPAASRLGGPWAGITES